LKTETGKTGTETIFIDSYRRDSETMDTSHIFLRVVRGLADNYAYHIINRGRPGKVKIG